MASITITVNLRSHNGKSAGAAIEAVVSHVASRYDPAQPVPAWMNAAEKVGMGWYQFCDVGDEPRRVPAAGIQTALTVEFEDDAPMSQVLRSLRGAIDALAREPDLNQRVGINPVVNTDADDKAQFEVRLY